MLEFSVIICTYNRANILSKCLTSLREQHFPKDQYELIIVNNNSTDNTEEMALSFANDWPHFHYIVETNQWLSQARNAGSRRAKGNTFIFLDDDVIIPETYLDRVAYIKNQFNFSCWGGIDIPFYLEEKPHWVKDQYLQFRLPYKDFHQIDASKKECVAGFSFIIKKDVLFDFGGFDPRVGMKGDVVGYGEETFLQYQLHAKGIPIGYDPKLIVKHHMLPHKLKLKWYFEAADALGKSQAVFKRDVNGFPFFILIGKTFLELCIVTCIDLSKSTFKWAFEKDFYWQNWLIESFKKIFKRKRFIKDLILRTH
jgi:glycosyltransferase involved in cell wall biosynthesis